MKVPIYQIDTFTSKVFSGNPAAVCPLEEWLDDSTLQAIAQENNLSETAFFVQETNGYHIRWFTPVKEIDLCGHATLATAFVIFNYLGISSSEIEFSSRGGKLTVSRKQDLLAMDFPSKPPLPCKIPKELLEGLKREPVEILCSEDYFVVFSNEKDISSLNPNIGKFLELELRGVIKPHKTPGSCRGM